MCSCSACRYKRSRCYYVPGVMKLLYSSKLVSPAKVLNTNLICMDSQRHLKESKDGHVTLYMLPYTGTSTLIPLAHRTTCITKVRCGVCRNSASKIGRLGPFGVGGVTKWCTVHVVMTKGAGSVAKALAIWRSTAAFRICAAMSLVVGVQPQWQQRASRQIPEYACRTHWYYRRQCNTSHLCKQDTTEGSLANETYGS